MLTGPVNPESKQEQADPSDRRLDAELRVKRDELELESILTLDSFEHISSSRLLLLLLHSIKSTFSSIFSRGILCLWLFLSLTRLNPDNGSKNTGNFSTCSLNQLLPSMSTKDLSSGNCFTARHVSNHCAWPAETYIARTGSFVGNQWPGNDQRSSTARMHSQYSGGIVGCRYGNDQGILNSKVFVA